MGVAARTRTPRGLAALLTGRSSQVGPAALHTMAAMTPTEQLRSRLLGTRPTDRVWGWVAPLVVAAVGGFLRFWRLGDPHQLVFDETYYVKQAYSMLQHGFEERVPQSIKFPDNMFTNGTPNVFGTDADFVVHPPVGKWVIAAGEQLFGPADVRIDADGHDRRDPARLRGPSLRALPHRPARPHRHVLGVRGLLRPAGRPRPLARDPRPQGRRAAGGGRTAYGPGAEVGPLAGAAPVAVRGRRLPGALGRHEVVRCLLPGRVRADDGAVGHGRPPGGRHPPVVARGGPRGRPVCRPGHGGPDPGRLRLDVGRVVPFQGRVGPAVGGNAH